MATSIVYTSGVQGLLSAHKVILSPFLTGPLLAAVSYTPDAVRDALVYLADRIPGLQLSPSMSLDTSKTVLKVLFGVSVLRFINNTLTTMGSNSWRLSRAPGWDWPKEIAVVTGGASGIGKGIVERLSKMGVRVAVLDIQEPPKTLLADPKVHFYKCDVTSTESIAAAADAVRSELGHPSILINNAGITSLELIMNTSEEFLRRIFGVNCMSHWFTAQQFLPNMIKQDKGHVVTVASLASFVALPTVAFYGATKAAARSFHEVLTCELKHIYKAPHVLTTVVHPNFARTPMLDGMLEDLEKMGVSMISPDDVSDAIVAQLRSRRGGQLIVPSTFSWAVGIRGWPIWMQEIVRDTLGRGASTMPHAQWPARS